MIRILYAIFLLCLSSVAANADKFTQVFEWTDALDYKLPPEPSRTQILEDGTFKPEPRFMAVSRERILLSLNKHFITIPASLVSLPTSSTSSAPPKLTPIPSWDMHISERGNCNKIEEAKGLQVDAHGRLWVLDNGSENCNAKIWNIDLANNDHTEIIHRFSFHGPIHDLVLDETPEGTFSYITRLGEQHIVVFSLERNDTWMVETQGIRPYSIALSPKEPKQLYLSYSDELYSIRVAELRNGNRTVNPKLIGKFTAEAYIMLMDNQGTLYAALLEKNYIISWNTFKPFEEQRLHEVAGLNSARPFTFAKDQNGTLWLMVFDHKRKPRFRLSKDEVGSQSFKASQEFDGASRGEDNVVENSCFQYNTLLVVFLVVLISGLSVLVLRLLSRYQVGNYMTNEQNRSYASILIICCL